MKIIPLLVVLFVPIAALAQHQWCNAAGECIEQLKNHKLVNVPFWWKTPNIKLVQGEAKNVKKKPSDPQECDELVVSPEVCEKD